MTATLVDNGHSTDAELVAQSRHGNREAFGRIVRRYQGMVSGVIYSFCGDFHRSEDLAQETFISAWKSLSGMNEPEKLAPWLCQIARHKTLDSQRASSREKGRLGHLFHIPAGRTPASPPQEALAAEERELLWRILSELPQPYRETMVLYYRQRQSTAAVAHAMETTEEAVRQRLARGREMLREHVAATLERDLVRSAPGPAFALVVLAALPALAPEVVKAATLGAAAKGSAATLGGGGALSWVTPLLGPFVGLWGGSLALRGAWRSSQSPRERRFIVYMAVVLGLCLAAPFVPYFVAKLFPGHGLHGLRGLNVTWVMIIFTIAATVIVLLGRRQWTAIRQSEAPDGNLPAPAPCDPARIPRWLIVGIVVSSLAWIFNLAWKAGDTSSLAILSVLAIALMAVAEYCWRHASIVVSRRFTLLYVPIIGLVTLIVTKWFVSDWVRLAHPERHVHPIKWTILLLMAAAFACSEVLVVTLVGRKKQDATKA